MRLWRSGRLSQQTWVRLSTVRSLRTFPPFARRALDVLNSDRPGGCGVRPSGSPGGIAPTTISARQTPVDIGPASIPLLATRSGAILRTRKFPARRSYSFPAPVLASAPRQEDPYMSAFSARSDHSALRCLVTNSIESGRTTCGPRSVQRPGDFPGSSSRLARSGDAISGLPCVETMFDTWSTTGDLRPHRRQRVERADPLLSPSIDGIPLLCVRSPLGGSRAVDCYVTTEGERKCPRAVEIQRLQVITGPYAVFGDTPRTGRPSLEGRDRESG